MRKIELRKMKCRSGKKAQEDENETEKNKENKIKGNYLFRVSTCYSDFLLMSV
jgi:hypothetical protein